MNDENKGPNSTVLKNPIVDAYLKALGAYLALAAAIERSGYDVSPCLICQDPVVCIADGLAMCKHCAEKASQ